MRWVTRASSGAGNMPLSWTDEAEVYGRLMTNIWRVGPFSNLHASKAANKRHSFLAVPQPPDTHPRLSALEVVGVQP